MNIFSKKFTPTIQPVSNVNNLCFKLKTHLQNHYHHNLTPRTLFSTQSIPAKEDISSKRDDNNISDEKTNFKTNKTSLEDALPFSSIPGPGGLKKIPYIGTLLLFKPFTKHTIETFGKLACELHDKYGPVFRTRLGKHYTVHTCSVKDIEHIFRQEPKYPERRLMNLSRVYRERNGLPQGLGSCNGEDWYTIRKPLNVVMKRPKAVQSYLPSLNGVADDFIQRLLEVKGEDQSERAKEMFKLFFKYSSEGIGVACFNQRLGFLAHDLDNCPEKQKLLESFRLSVECTFRDIMGMERRYVKTENDKFYQTYSTAMNYIRQQSLVSVKKILPSSTDKEKSIDDADDDSSVLLKTLVRRDDLNMDQVLAIIDSLLIAGTDSTARILTVLLYDMAQNRDIQDRVANEVRAFAGPNGPITSQCVDQVRILRACVKESMRVHFPVSSGVERIMPRDIVMSGYRVPAGTSVFMTGVYTSRDPNHFPNPSAFMPERWLRAEPQGRPSQRQSPTSGCPVTSSSNSADVTNNKHQKGTSSEMRSSSAFAFIPFGHGVRSCIGSRFAEMELLVGLAKVLQQLDVSVHPCYKSLEVNYTPFITPLEPIPFIFTKR